MFLPEASLDYDPPTYASHTAVQPCAAMPSLLVEMGFH
jgi:hypothetical protein